MLMRIEKITSRIVESSTCPSIIGRSRTTSLLRPGQEVWTSPPIKAEHNTKRRAPWSKVKIMVLALSSNFNMEEAIVRIQAKYTNLPGQDTCALQPYIHCTLITSSTWRCQNNEIRRYSNTGWQTQKTLQRAGCLQQDGPSVSAYLNAVAIGTRACIPERNVNALPNMGIRNRSTSNSVKTSMILQPNKFE